MSMERYPDPIYWEDPFANGVESQSHPDASYVKDVEKVVNDELHAIHYYAKLMELAPDVADRQRISSIRQDEIRHYHHNYRYYMQLTGRHPQLHPGSVPEQFENGVRVAIGDELEAAVYYQQLAQRTSDPRIRQMFQQHAQDEQRHAMWLMFISGQRPNNQQP